MVWAYIVAVKQIDMENRTPLRKIRRYVLVKTKFDTDPVVNYDVVVMISH